ncbi:cation-translocating P-type ATPase [Rivularia sp. UHCC 0363]|uniref:cation-translocating P-type ATPase n=1 Tax=Rivularia sp. UHCC 0363 TaxID=3110244 RepID=UPI002B1F1932|nr:cation-translocating P-type ATPase [Rivularia sp. UHCC 0363]MEA5597092.1 cation-translocating P-type ATPase [Rivularia sp. UHCC 0363]
MSAHSLPEHEAVWHSLEVGEAIKLLSVNADTGLTSPEVESRLQKYGTNELEESAGRGSWEILVDQFKNIMLLMLIAVAIVSGVMDLLALQAGNLKPGEVPFKDTIAIMAIVILNGILGYLQESRAEKALAALKKLSAPNVRVIRDGKLLDVEGKHLVPGDIMFLEAGVQVSADGRLIEQSNLQIRESALTGEAEAVNKRVEIKLPEDTSLGDRINLVFQGTEVVQGRAKVLVTHTGMKTELGKIAELLQSVKSEDTPLQQRMTQLGNVLVGGSLALVVLVIAIGLLRGGNLQELVEVSLSMAVAVVPEGLPAVITVTLALGTQRMVRRNALIRKLPAVETLGSVTTICSDKTGTLTQNKMVVQSVYTGDRLLKVTGEGYAPQGEFELEGTRIDVEDYPEIPPLLVPCAVCNDAVLQQEKGDWIILGDPTEGALVTLAGKGGIEQDQWNSKLPRVGEFPFSSERKRMSVICQVEQINTGSTLRDVDPAISNLLTSESYLMFTKGSPELILQRCTQIYTGKSAVELTQEQREKVLAENDRMAGQGLRVLGFAYKPLIEKPPEGSDEQYEQGLVWLGLVGMLDAPRPEVRASVKECREAGIRPVMITGDHQLTARAIATDLGIANSDDKVLTGQELQRMSDAELEQNVDSVNIYARVSPEHKLRIVQALQRRHQFVAMTGDGVNDAPALKQADIGIAMGITGTDVSKEASDMVLLDDNFATIVAATREGRVVYTNIRRFIKYILGSNIGEVIAIAASTILLPTAGVPLIPLQILWMNLVTDGLPALALAVEPAEPDVMKRPPFNPRESIFARGLGFYMIRIGIIFAILTIILMRWAYYHTHGEVPDPNGLDPERWKTMVFTTLCIAQMGHAIAIRSNNQLTIEINPFSNPYLLAAVVLTTILQLMLIYVPPLRAFFGTHILSLSELGVCLGFSALMFVWIELEKIFFRIIGKKNV